MRSTSLSLIALMLCQYGGAGTYAGSPNLQSRRPSLSDRVFPQELEDNRFDSLLAELKETVEHGGAKTKSAPEQGFADIRRLSELKESLVEENEKIQEYFGRFESSLKQKNLPGEILNRHVSFVREYDAKYQALMESLKGIESSHKDVTGLWAKLTGKKNKVDWNAAIGKTLNFLEKNTARPRENHFDPGNLPHRSLRVDKAIPPKLTREEWLKAFPRDSGAPAAKANEFVLATAPPASADLAETIEVKFTPEIIELADSLGKSPVKIFNWVRNNIEFVPTWGSIQGAQLCLETRTGNAFDTASLLIALLRYSGIPARYQMGTIEVPIEKFKNWAGGFTDADAAASLFASGGTPSVVRRVNQSGQVVTVKLEHVWVKAFVDYSPSGGTVNIQGDAWVDLDPSFKQHTLISPSTDLSVALPFNRDQYLSSTTTESPVEYYRQQLADFVKQNYPGKTLEDFLIKKTIKIHAPSLLSGSLPWTVLTGGTGFSSIPDSLRQRVTFEVTHLGSSSPTMTYTTFLAQLRDKRVSLSFMPASATDTQVAASFQGMYFVPPYMLSLKPVLRLDGIEVASGSPLGMGRPTNLTIRLRLTDGTERIIQNEITAGAYSSILLAPHMVTDKVANALGKKLDSGVFDNGFGKLNIDNSERDDWVASGLQGLGTYYFNRLDESVRLLKELFPAGEFKTAYQATASADVEVSSVFGTPRQLKVMGVSIDADLLEDIAVSRNGVSAVVAAFEKLRGLESSFWEHATLEANGVTPETPSVSTVRALQRANALGIQVLKINKGNLATIEPILQIPEKDKEAVRDAINAGLEVTIPASNLQFGSWSGVGYIVEDPLTGAGAYQISGGLSGSIVERKWPGLAPSPPNAPAPKRPSAILAVGIAPCANIWCSLGDRWVNDFTVAETIGGTLHSFGYNVYVASVSMATLPVLVGTGDQTPNDVFYFIGHGWDGGLVLRRGPNDETYDLAYPGHIGRKFKIALLTACATGADCTTCANGQCISCTPSSARQMAWDSILLNPQSGSALIGYTKLIPIVTSNAEAKVFWAVVNTVRVGDLVGSADGAFLRGDPNTTLPMFPTP